MHSIDLDKNATIKRWADQHKLDITGLSVSAIEPRVRAAIPEGHALARAEFNTLRLKLLKVAVRVVEYGSRIRAHLPSSMPEKTLYRAIALGLSPPR